MRAEGGEIGDLSNSVGLSSCPGNLGTRSPNSTVFVTQESHNQFAHQNNLMKCLRGKHSGSKFGDDQYK